MFEYLKRHRRVIVTGPQRAGTRIAARMIASDTGYFFLDENVIEFDNSELMALIFGYQTRFVLHCPVMSSEIHKYGDWVTAIVFMFRDLDEIKRSQARIAWDDTQERQRYGVIGDPRNIAEVKYEFWQRQKRCILHHYEVQYETLANHPLWLPNEKRVNFGIFQTQLDCKCTEWSKCGLLTKL